LPAIFDKRVDTRTEGDKQMDCILWLILSSFLVGYCAGETIRLVQSIRAYRKDERLKRLPGHTGSTKRCVTRGTQRAATVLRALGVTDLDPPTPPQPGETVA
jgi:hypothetical protein